MSGTKIEMPEGWYPMSRILEGGPGAKDKKWKRASPEYGFASDDFEEDVRIVRRRNRGEDNLIQWCCIEDGQHAAYFDSLHDAFRHFEEDWVSPSEALLATIS